MKKLLLGLMSAIMLIATSCQTASDVDVTAANGTLATVTFNVGAPQMSRAYSDGLTANELHYAVYAVRNNNGVETLEYLPALTGVKPIELSTNVEVQLTTGNKYAMIFWAAAENKTQVIDALNSKNEMPGVEPHYAINLPEKSMTVVDYDKAISSVESRDAFYKYEEFEVSGSFSKTVELKRPFAQLNIGTNDYQQAKAAGYEYKYAKVKVANIFSTLDFVSGIATGETEVVFDYAPITYDYATGLSTEKFPVVGYEYMAMNYLLMNLEQDAQTINVTFSYALNENGENEKSRTIGSVPVNRNHRTNVYGQLLTSKINFNVIIKPEYDDPGYNYPSTSHQELLLAATAGGSVTLNEDVVLVEPLNITASLTLNLNGKTISLDKALYADANGEDVQPSVLNVAKGATLVISNGTVSSLGENAGSALISDGTVIATDMVFNGAPQSGNKLPKYAVNNGGVMTLTNTKITSVHGGVASYGNEAVATLNNCTIDMSGIAGMTSHALYTDGGKIVVDGGVYANNAADQATTGGSVINGDVEVLNGAFVGHLNGTPVLKGGNYTVDPTSYLATGYEAVEVAGKYYVVPVGVSGITAVIESNLGIDVNVDDETAASAVEFKTMSAAYATAVATDNGAKTLFNWNGISYVAEFEKATIYASPANTESMRYIVEGSNVKEATVAEGITVVGNRTFRKCTHLTTVSLPSTLVEVGPAAFQQCAALTNIVLPTSVKTIGDQAFYGCTALASINIPEGVTRIERFGLRATGLTSIELPASVTYIGEFAFRDCESLTEVVINAPSFTCEANAFLNAAPPICDLTIKVVNKPMKAYLETLLAGNTNITVVEM